MKKVRLVELTLLVILNNKIHMKIIMQFDRLLQLPINVIHPEMIIKILKKIIVIRSLIEQLIIITRIIKLN